MNNRLRMVFLLVLALTQLGADFRVALPGYRYRFPHDNFNHPDFQTEWWYYSGNLKATDGHRFGFELTFFRRATQPDETLGTEHFAHLALSDISGQKFYRLERVSHAVPGLAGADEKQASIWNGNWQVLWKGDQQSMLAKAGDISLQLSLVSHKPPAIHGESGVSQKGPGAGHASCYISLTRLLTTGSIDLKGKSYRVEGTAWMDHEFFTERLQEDKVGWDWFGLQLDDNTEIMLYRFRRKDGAPDPFSAGTYVARDGSTIHLRASDFSLKPLGETWKSPDTIGAYPTAWQISVPSRGIQLTARTPLPTQEIVSARGLTPSYWEGAIDLSGTTNNVPITGKGYLEMTGYDGAIPLGN